MKNIMNILRKLFWLEKVKNLDSILNKDGFIYKSFNGFAKLCMYLYLISIPLCVYWCFAGGIFSLIPLLGIFLFPILYRLVMWLNIKTIGVSFK